MLTFSLKNQWYEKIRSGEKTIEYREANPYWTKKFENEFGRTVFDLSKIGDSINPNVYKKDFRCLLQKGYTKEFLTARVPLLVLVDGKDTDLAIDTLVFAIHLADVREV